MRQAAAEKLHETEDLDRFRDLLRQGGTGPHGYASLLGLHGFDAASLLKNLQRGLPFRAFERLSRSVGLSTEDLRQLVDIPRRTLARRRSEGRFSVDESDRLVRSARLFGKALALFEGDRVAAMSFLRAPQPALAGAIPLEIARTELGGREVEAMIHRLEHGVFM